MVSQAYRIILVVILLSSCNGKKEAQVAQQNTKTKKTTISEIEAGIKDFIQKKTQENDGYFHVEDKGNEYRMKLVRVH
ncbi:MAG: transglutaminase domain-containing protein, partial [Cyclobacteriaceae bacterium]